MPGTEKSAGEFKAGDICVLEGLQSLEGDCDQQQDIEVQCGKCLRATAGDAWRATG